MQRDEGKLYCEYCDNTIVVHRNMVIMYLNRRENGLGVECDECWSARQKREDELYDREGFPKLVESQYQLLSDASKKLEEYLSDTGSHFFPIEYDCYDLDGEIKSAKSNVDWMRRRIKNVFPKVFKSKGGETK